ncbi:MAG TPA: hypothetical protein VFD56_05970 [Chitinophagaceae bacterium]|nr:hypothetical protein [Chitinophagaceae bacterium]
MKKIITGVFSVLFLLPAAWVSAQEVTEKKKEKFAFVKEKNISKTYPASGNNLSIDNSFGNVKFTAWDKNEIKIDVHIEASSDKEDVAQKIFDAISVSDKHLGKEIEFKTKIENNNNNCKNCKSSMQIDFDVHLPVTVELDVSNSFGNIELPDYKGAVAVSSKFGKLTAGSLSNVKEVGVEFGSAAIKGMSNIDAEFKFSKIDIDNLGGKNKIKLEFCDATSIRLGTNLTSLDLNESYSTVNLRPGNLSATYNITTSFGSVVDRSTADIKRTDTPDKYGPDSDKTYTGKSGSGSANIEIRSSFGKIIVGEATAEDLESKKDKSKNKSKGSKVVF